MRRFKGLGLIIALIMLFTLPALAATLTGQLGGVDSNGDYQFTVNTDGVLNGSDLSVIKARVVEDYELITATEESVVLADSGKIMIATATATTTFTLPAAVVGMEFTFVAGKGQTVKIDPATTADTIAYLTLGVGDEMDSSGATGDSVTLKCYQANTWIPIDMGSSAFTDGGSS